ncbi:MAG: redoxin domain-containing protein [Actinomycetia bacterium]|nr:redoxin domain-containing protein [Actinomycetes bacterium]
MKNKPGRMGIAVGSLAVISMAVIAGVFAARLSNNPQSAPSPLIGTQSPTMTLPLLDGSGEVAIPDPGAEVTIINFFASWCLECRVEHADLMAVADAFQGAGVRLIQIAYQDRTSDAIAFINELGVSPLVHYTSDPDSRAAISFGVFGIPETYFIGPQGTVTARITGPSTALQLGEEIDRILLN